MEVCEQGELDPLETISPGLVTVLRVDAQTQNLGLGRVELLQQSVQTRNLDASSRGEVEGVGHEEDILLATELGQRHRSVEMTVEREVRCRGSRSDQRHGEHLCLLWDSGSPRVRGLADGENGVAGVGLASLRNRPEPRAWPGSAYANAL